MIEFNEGYDLPDDVQAAAEDAIAQLSSGEMQTGVGAAPATTTATDGSAAPTATEAPATTGG